MTDSQKLLADYAECGSEAAFRELAERYLDLVYSTAVRLADGDTHRAEDVAQTVFIDLARLAKAKRLTSEVRLGGWLHRHTCFVAAKTMRGERRRQFRERQAVEMNALPDHSQSRLAEAAPILDEAINQLGEADRAAVLLRFYERLDFRAIGAALGSNEDAAQKRVTRALEKLHGLLKQRGVALSVTALGAALAGEAVTAAPAGLAASIAGAAVSGAGNSFALLKLMASIKLKTSAAVAAVIAASVLAPRLMQQHAQGVLDAQRETRQRQSNQIAQLSADNQRLASLAASAEDSRGPSNSQFRELLRLRGQVGLLKSRVQQMTAPTPRLAPLSPQDQIASLSNMYTARVASFKQWLDANPSQKIPELARLDNESWLNAVDGPELVTDEDFDRAARLLRATRKARCSTGYSAR